MTGQLLLTTQGLEKLRKELYEVKKETADLYNQKASMSLAIRAYEEEVEKLCEEGKIHPFDYMLLQTAFSMKAILQGMIQENDLKKLFKEDDDFFKKLKAIKTVDDFLTQF